MFVFFRTIISLIFSNSQVILPLMLTNWGNIQSYVSILLSWTQTRWVTMWYCLDAKKKTNCFVRFCTIHVCGRESWYAFQRHFELQLKKDILFKVLIFFNITIIAHTTLHVVMSRNIYLLPTTKDLIICHYPIQCK